MVDAAADLELIPRSVRDKLDRIGVKLHLKEWQQLPLQERVQLRDLPGDSTAEIDAYRRCLEEMVYRRTGSLPEKLKTTRTA